MNHTANAKPMLWANSPASVLGMLPPHIEFPSLNRNIRLAAAPTAIAGARYPRARSASTVVTGRRNEPVAVTTLKAALKGTTRDNARMSSEGGRK